MASCSDCNELLPSSFWARLAWKSFEPEPNTYHVTSLTRCLAHSYFDRTLKVEETVESAWAKLRGTLLHYAGRSFGWNELRVKMSFEVNSETVTIVGFVDAYEPETATVYDLKTTRFVKWQVEKGHIPRRKPHCPTPMLLHLARLVRHTCQSTRPSLRGRSHYLAETSSSGPSPRVDDQTSDDSTLRIS